QNGQATASYGGEATSGSGYSNINGGWSHQTMFIFYGADADMDGANGGNAQQQATTWAPGSQVLAANPAAVDQLLLLAGRGEQGGAHEPNAPIVTATAMVHLLIPRLQAAITAAQADADWANLTAGSQGNIGNVVTAI